MMADDPYDQIQQAYETGAEAYAAHFNKPHDFIDHERQYFVNALPRQARILDVGCGPGEDTAYFAKLGFDVVAIDLSEKMIEIARQKAPAAKFVQIDMRHYTDEPASFDGIWAAYSFLHIHRDDAKAVLENFARLLKSEGLLVLAVHAPEKTAWASRKVAGLFDRDRQIETFFQEWNGEDLKNLLRQSGFEIDYDRPFMRTGGMYPLLSIAARVKKA